MIHQSMSTSAQGKLVIASILNVDGPMLKPSMTSKEIESDKTVIPAYGAASARDRGKIRPGTAVAQHRTLPWIALKGRDER